MKKLISLLTFALLMSCSSGPQSVAKNFSEKLAKGKVEEAKKLATESTGKLLDFMAGFGGVKINPDFECEIVKDSVVKNKAWVTLKDEKGEEKELQLVKIDGKWLVHMESKK